MYTELYSISTNRFQSKLVKIEASMSKGMFAFSVLGSTKAYSKKIYDKVTSILKSMGLRLPPRRILININDCISNDYDLFDLPILLAILELIGYIKLDKTFLYIGHLMLNGDLKELDNSYSIIKSSIDLGVKKLIIPKKKDLYNIYADKTKVLLAENLSDLIEYFRGYKKLQAPDKIIYKDIASIKPDINDIVGQEKLVKALILSIVGRHHILIEGASGSGKTYAVKAIESILPQSLDEDLLYLNANNRGNKTFINRPYFNYVYPSLTPKQLIGGQRQDSCLLNSDRGFLVMNEICLFSNPLLNNLRIPMDENRVKINMNKEEVILDTFFTIIATMNPCPCGNLYSQVKKCTCSQGEINAYQRKMSYPLKERFHISIRVDNEPGTKDVDRNNYDIDKIKNKILQAWNIQRQRYRTSKIYYNGLVDDLTFISSMELESNLNNILVDLKAYYGLSERKMGHLLRISRSIADYEGEDHLSEDHIYEAINYLI